MKRTLTSFLACLLLAVASQAQIVDFDDLPASSDGYAIGTGYAGLNWNNFYRLTGLSYPSPSGYHAGIISPENIAFNAYGHPASILALGDATFSVQSAFLTGAWNDDLQIQLQGFRDGSLVSGYDFSVLVSATEPTKVLIGFENIDELKFTASGGTRYQGYQGVGTQFVLDDLALGSGPAQAVPEPSTYGLIGAGALLGLAFWRRRAARR